MIVFPKSKINLGLRITGRRDDGYHDIETLFYPVRLLDAMEFVVAEGNAGRDELVVTGLPLGVDPGENIVMKAIRGLRENISFPWLRIHLHKVIPHGAGLGGGSSDAACLLKSVSRHFSLSIGDKELYALALSIGSDCPFFINGGPAFATGRGEVLTPADHVLAGYYLVLLNPGVMINTAEAYRNCTPGKTGDSLTELTGLEISEWKDRITNDFEDFAFRKHPVIRKIKEDLYKSGALFCLMSGSGSSVFGIFRGKPVDLPSGIRSMVIWEGIM